MAKGKNSTKIVTIIVVVLIVLAAGAITAFYLTGDTVRTRTLAVISFEGRKAAEVTDLELQYELLEIIAQYNYVYGISTRQDVLSFWRSAYGGSNRLDLLKEQLLKELTDRKIVLLLAKESGFDLTKQEEDELLATFEDMRVQYKEAGNDIDDYLVSTYGISFRMFREITRNRKLEDTYKASYKNEIEILDDEIVAFYEENKAEYHVVTMQHILLFTVDATNTPLSSTARQEKRQLAELLLNRIKEGESMELLVAEFSEDTTKANNLGYYDIKSGSGFAESLENWALKSHPGDIDIIDTAYGIHIARNHTATGLDSVFEQVKNELKVRKYTEHLDIRRQEYDIMIYDSVLVSIDPLS